MSLTHRTQAGTATYDPRGITLRPRFGRHSLFLPWTNVDFLSPTPGLRHSDAGWQDFTGRPAADLRRLELAVALHDRHQLHVSGWWAKLWLRRFTPGVLLRADDRPHPRAGFLCIDVRLSTLSAPRAAFFDLLAAHARFDIIAFDY